MLPSGLTASALSNFLGWLSKTTTDSIGLATWLALIVAAIGGGVLLRTNRDGIRLRHSEAERAAEDQAARMFFWVNDAYSKVAMADYDYSPLRLEDPQASGWKFRNYSLPTGESVTAAITGQPILAIRNGSNGQVKVESVALTWTGVIDSDHSADPDGYPWRDFGEAVGIAADAGTQALRTIILFEETRIPHFHFGTRLDLPGLHLDTTLPWMRERDTETIDLADGRNFVIDAFVLEPAEGVRRDQLMAVFVEVTAITLTDAFGRRWRRRLDSIEALPPRQRSG